MVKMSRRDLLWGALIFGGIYAVSAMHGCAHKKIQLGSSNQPSQSFVTNVINNNIQNDDQDNYLQGTQAPVVDLTSARDVAAFAGSRALAHAGMELERRAELEREACFIRQHGGYPEFERLERYATGDPVLRRQVSIPPIERYVVGQAGGLTRYAATRNDAADMVNAEQQRRIAQDGVAQKGIYLSNRLNDLLTSAESKVRPYFQK